MKYLLSGYYGFGNAGDEAVLAAILEAVSAQSPGERFIVTSGDPAATEACHNTSQHPVEAVPRQQPRALLQAIRSCDVFISGGGSLLQDVTSLRNVVYYTGLMRLARLSRKPVVVYAQGMGPLRRTLSQKLARVAVQGARIVTVRDEESKALLRRIGVRRTIEVTADPVWALNIGPEDISKWDLKPPVWGVSLRPWPNARDPLEATRAVETIQKAAFEANANACFFVMQKAQDLAVIDGSEANIHAQEEDIYGLFGRDEDPRGSMARAGQCDVMIAMRLHALIFAAAQRVPCVAINYDPKVEALARLIGAPLLQDLSESELARLPAAVAQARPISAERLADLQRLARRNAELAVSVEA